MERENKLLDYVKIILIFFIFLFVFLYIIFSSIGRVSGSNIYFDSKIMVSSEKKNWTQVKSLNIFNNEDFNQKKMISPGSKGIYAFSVQNIVNNEIPYKMVLSEEYGSFVNMKYRIKRNGKYIVGDDQNYISIKDMDISIHTLSKKENDDYLLEWCWFDHEDDTESGFKNNYYTLKIELKTTDGNMIGELQDEKNN